ncbi:hypothetical protein K2X05_08740 [bacterium]|nr:hypothetical protein [bacterium]
MKNLSWKEKFNVPKDSEHSLIEILRSGFINEDEYLQWASETYQLPVVTHDFFKTLNNYKLVLENPSPHWSETFFPAAEWDNTLFIVCLEPQQIELSKPYNCILASLFRMETLWNKMEKQASENPVEISFSEPVLSQEEPMNLVIEEKLTSPDFSFDSIVQETPTSEPDASGEPPQDPAPDFAPPPQSHASYSASENVYEDSKITSLFSQMESSTQISIPDFVVDELLKPELPPPIENTATGIRMNPNASGDSFNTPEITNVVNLGKTKPEITFTNTKTILPFPDRSTHFSFIRTVFSEQVILEARGKVKENTDPHQALICAFHILKDYYKKLMWAVRDQKGAVFPIASNTAWDFSEEAWNTPIDFKSPNPFRIAKFTAKPYHGEVYPNPINDHFFQLWNAGKYPPVMTIVPVRLQGKVFAYFIGCEPALHYHPTNSLDIMQSTCEELIQTFVTIHKELNPKAA